jgi:hypothetical protein
MCRLSTLMVFLFLLGGGAWAVDTEKKDMLVVDRFTEGVDDRGLPKGWSLEKTPGNQSKVSIEKEDDNFSLHLLSVNDSFGLKKEIPFNIQKFPYLSWRWKIYQLPESGDIRNRATDDQAGQVYVVFPKFPTMVNSRAVGYIWDSAAPQGSSGTSKAYGKMRYIVLESGLGKADQWVEETRNVYKDYKRLFREEPPAAGGVLLYINSQHTKSFAEISYADIFFSASQPRSPK